LFVTVPALAENVVVAPPKTGSMFWDIISYVLGVIAVPLMGILAKMALDWQSKLAAEKEEKRSSLREKLRYEAEVVLARIAANLANKQVTELKIASADGKISKEELKKLGEQAITEAKAELGASVAKTLGDAALKSILRKKVDDMKNGGK
jgi:hypothetical protein